MRLHEFSELQERSYTHPGIRAHLIALKYSPSGEGRDQTTWKSPEGNILKIFGTQEGQEGFTEDHKMFKAWTIYCKSHASNPYIPHFSDWIGFEYPLGSKQMYLQIKMEKLSEIPDEEIKELLEQIDLAITEGRSYATFKRIVAQEMGTKFVTTTPWVKDPTLFNTVLEINTIGNKHGWGLDLHHGCNYMMRGNQIVIVDPWIVDPQGSGSY
jgi:hypothetical protein